MPPKKNLKLSAVRLRRLSLIFAGGIPRRRRRRNAFGLIQEYCTRGKKIFKNVNQRGVKNIILVIVVIIAVAAGYFVLSKNHSTAPPYSVTADNTFITNIDGYFEACGNTTTVYKRFNGRWVKASSSLRTLGAVKCLII